MKDMKSMKVVGLWKKRAFDLPLRSGGSEQENSYIGLSLRVLPALHGAFWISAL
jgi:hypothetical protein